MGPYKGGHDGQATERAEHRERCMRLEFLRDGGQQSGTPDRPWRMVKRPQPAGWTQRPDASMRAMTSSFIHSFFFAPRQLTSKENVLPTWQLLHRSGKAVHNAAVATAPAHVPARDVELLNAATP